jgi:hypothetical protein
MKVWKILKISLISLLISNIALPDDPTLLNKDQAAPYQGLLFSIGKANDLKNSVLERDSLLKINESLNKSITLQENIISKQNEKVDILLTQNDRLAKSLGDERVVGSWERFGYFLLGIVATVGAGFAINQAGR